jgi:hypothetical protein
LDETRRDRCDETSRQDQRGPLLDLRAYGACPSRCRLGGKGHLRCWTPAALREVCTGSTERPVGERAVMVDAARNINGKTEADPFESPRLWRSSLPLCSVKLERLLCRNTGASLCARYWIDGRRSGRGRLSSSTWIKTSMARRKRTPLNPRGCGARPSRSVP